MDSTEMDNQEEVQEPTQVHPNIEIDSNVRCLALEARVALTVDQSRLDPTLMLILLLAPCQGIYIFFSRLD